MNLNIIHDEKAQRFYVESNGYTSDLLYTKVDDTTLNCTSTFVPNELRGQGIAAELVKSAIKYAQENGYKIMPGCSYVKAYFDRHPELSNIVKR